MTRLRLGLLSTARINGMVLAGAAASDEVEVTAVASRDAAKARGYAETHGLERSHGSYESLLADPDVDAVYISLPNALHHAWTVAALRAGKHVLCEKPYARRADEVEAAFSLASESGLVLMEAFMYRHHPQTARIRELVSEGVVGRVRLVSTSFRFPLGDLANIRASPGLDGGSLMDIGCYCVSGARMIGGEPLSVVGEQVVGATGVDMAFHGAMRFPDDLVAQFDCSFLLPEHQRLEVVGELGTIVAEAPWRVDLGGRLLLVADGREEEITVPQADSYRLELENLAAAVAGRAPALLGRDDALGQARAIEALYRSAEAGRRLSL
jgi:predicted dehydrogenase